ncbi:glycosyltransferase family 2 protein [Rheinheimera mesophila]|uniref:Glycosyltransferase family 2 protein n=1 Tax=Rheinheimera mesophila TaxID=1547515 RepID=A0A3P3QPN5_9GAMM|nr:glycosyltransferase family 2 protein [Rheinheimera mesophila]KKL00428.1 hypothetical protein SD53_14845 [Rheinheimera mesophila]RRJ23134.1 glycosyltransferase family 2 protein [Rheinheimera mesophila]
MSKIAVLIPTYRPGTYLEECLRCFESQTLSKEYFHVYIALNGPSTGYKEYIDSLVSRFTFNLTYSYIEHAGVSLARNFLIDNSVSDYITFVDDDDLVSENYLEELLAVADEQFIGISNVKNFEDDLTNTTSNYIGSCYESLSRVEKSLFRSRQFYSSPCAKLIHRSLISENRFKVGLALGEDSLFMSELSNRVSGVVKASNNPTYFVRQRVGSATRKKLNRILEIKRISYLVLTYIKMLVSFRYNLLFILTRILATLMHFRRIL